MRGKTTRSVPDGKSEHTVWVSEGAGMTMESVRRVADYGCGVELRLARRTAQKTKRLWRAAWQSTPAVDLAEARACEDETLLAAGA